MGYFVGLMGWQYRTPQVRNRIWAIKLDDGRQTKKEIEANTGRREYTTGGKFEGSHRRTCRPS